MADMILQHKEAHIFFFFRFQDILQNLTVPVVSVIGYTVPVKALYEVKGIFISVLVPSEWSKTNFVCSSPEPKAHW